MKLGVKTRKSMSTFRARFPEIKMLRMAFETIAVCREVFAAPLASTIPVGATVWEVSVAPALDLRQLYRLRRQVFPRGRVLPR